MGRRSFALLALFGASCVVPGFSIVDDLPGDGAAGGSVGAAGAGAGAGADTSQGGNGTSGNSTTQGGKAGTAGTPGQAGEAVATAGEASGEGGTGEGGAPTILAEPCDLDTTGQPPLLCDDFEAGVFEDSKWMPMAPAVAIEPGEGPHGPTKMVHIPGSQGLATMLGDFNLVGGEVTLSFWLKADATLLGAWIVRFRDRGLNNRSIRLVVLQQELGWENDNPGLSVPTMPTTAMVLPGQWACISIYTTSASIVLRYRSNGIQTVNTLTIDNMPTPGVDDTWQNQPELERFIGGYPSFGGDPAFPGDLFIDDVRIVRGTSSICPF